MQRNKGMREASHREAMELLPWFVNETLAFEEQVAVARHVEACRDCSNEVEAQTRIRDLIGDSPLIPMPTAKSFDHLMQRVDATEPVEDANRPVRFRQPLIAAAAIAALSISTLAVLMLTDRPGQLSEYTTLTDSSPESSAGPTLHVVFDRRSGDEVRLDMVRRAGGKIVAGPTPEGIYTIGVADGLDQPGAVDEVLKRLRGYPGVRLAEHNYQAGHESD